MSTHALEIAGLSVQYNGQIALEEVNLALPEGAFLSVVGPNGAGKSTLLRTALGLIPHAKGRIEVFGNTPKNVPSGVVGYVPQIKTLDRRFPALACELVATGLLKRWPGRLSASVKSRAISALKSIGADYLADRTVSRLSGGELQKVYLARGLIAEPRMVMLDEPATGVDIAGESDMYDLLGHYQREKNATVVMITHDLNAVCHLCTHVLVLNRRQLSFGSPTEALTDDSMRRAFGHVGHDHAMFIGVKHD